MTHWDFWETLSDSDTVTAINWADKQMGSQALSDNELQFSYKELACEWEFGYVAMLAYCSQSNG